MAGEVSPIHHGLTREWRSKTHQDIIPEGQVVRLTFKVKQRDENVQKETECHFCGHKAEDFIVEILNIHHNTLK